MKTTGHAFPFDLESLQSYRKIFSDLHAQHIADGDFDGAVRWAEAITATDKVAASMKAAGERLSAGKATKKEANAANQQVKG